MMRRFSDMGIRARISSGYIILILLMIGVILVGVSRIYAIRGESDHILHQDWAASAAINAIDTQSREAGTRIITLLIQNDQKHRVDSYSRNHRTTLHIDAHPELLAALHAPPEPRAQIEPVKHAPAAYYDPYNAVADMVE